MYKLIIGDKAFSSWSLRAWILLKKLNITFEEINIKLDQPDTKKNILNYSSAGLVPVLIHDKIKIWDSLSIALYLHTKHGKLLPADDVMLAQAYSIICEMHSGFLELRKILSSHFVATNVKFEATPALQEDINRILSIWQTTFQLSRSDGWLFGDFSIADAFYIPVAIGRFKTYNIQLPQFAQNYLDFILADQHIKEWLAAANLEE